MSRKIKKKLSKEQKSLLIGLLIGDGTISSNFVFKLSHSVEQREYLEWKVKLLDKFQIKNNGIKTPDVNTTIKKRTKFYNSNINDNKIKTFKDPNKQKAYFDFETIGDLSTGGANSPIFAATQLSIRRANGNNEDYIFESFHP